MLLACSGVGVAVGWATCEIGDAPLPGKVDEPPPMFPEQAASAATSASDAPNHHDFIEPGLRDGYGLILDIDFAARRLELG